MESSNFYDWLTAKCEIAGDSDGREVVIICPWCERPKLYASPRRGKFICFHCRERGSAVFLVAKVEGVTLPEAKKRMKDRRLPEGGSLERELANLERGARIEDAPENHELPEEFIPCFSGTRWRVPKYFDKREISDDMIVRHGLGFARRGRYRDRVIIPIVQGEHHTFLSRLMGPSSKFAWKHKVTGEWVEPPKYMTPKNAGLSSVLYGSTWASAGCDLVLVEGSFDAMRLIELGFSACAVLGKRLSVEQARLIVRLKPASVTFLYDAGATDAAAIDAETLSSRSSVPVFLATCPGDHDPDSLGLSQGRDGVLRTLASKTQTSCWTSLEACLAAL